MRQLRLRLLLYGVGVLVGIFCIWAGVRTDQWSLGFLGVSQVVLWSVRAGSTVHQYR